MEPDLWKGHEVTIFYPKIIDCTEVEMRSDLKNALKTVGALWLQEVNAAKGEKRATNQLKVLKKFILYHSLEFLHVTQLLQIMIATAANTSPVERGYSFLEMITTKRRNRMQPENIETQFY